MTDQVDGQARMIDLPQLEKVLELAARRAVELALDAEFGATGPVRIPFRDGMEGFSAEWAEGVLRELYDHHRETFGECVQAFLAEIRPVRRGRPKGAGNGG